MTQAQEKERWGDLNAGDATSDWELMVEDSAQRTAEFVINEGWKSMNRPIGSVPISPEQELADWVAGKEDVNYWQTMLEEAKQRGLGDIQAELAVREHDLKQQRRATRG